MNKNSTKYYFSKSLGDEATVTIFDGTNLDEWKEDVKLLMMRKNLWSLVLGKEQEPEDHKELLKYETRRQEAYAIITQSIARSHRDCIRKLGDECTDPNRAWNAVLQRFDEVTAVSMMLLFFQLLSLSQSSDLEEYFSAFNLILGKLSLIEGLNIPEPLLVAIMLKGLSTECKNIVTNVLQSTEQKVLKVDDVMQEMRYAESNREALYGSKDKSINVTECIGCKLGKHTEDDCWIKHPHKRPKCDHCGEKGHYTNNCRNRKKPASKAVHQLDYLDFESDSEDDNIQDEVRYKY